MQMKADYLSVQKLLNERADCRARLKLLPYEGSPEIKERDTSKYLYVRKRIAGKLTSTYVDIYSEELYQILLRNAKEARELTKKIRQINKELVAFGFEDRELTVRIARNIDFARANMKANIYDQAVLEGIATTFPQTESIIENGKITGVSATDVQKVLNLKRAWEFILDEDVIQSDSNYYMLCHIAKLVNEGFFHEGGRIRGVPVTIGGCNYTPAIPIESNVMDSIRDITSQDKEVIDIAIEACLYCMKTQVFMDGNKRAAIIFANQYLIARGMGFLVIPEKSVPKFKKLLVDFYEGEEQTKITMFMKSNCWRSF